MKQTSSQPTTLHRLESTEKMSNLLRLIGVAQLWKAEYFESSTVQHLCVLNAVNSTALKKIRLLKYSLWHFQINLDRYYLSYIFWKQLLWLVEIDVFKDFFFFLFPQFFHLHIVTEYYRLLVYFLVVTKNLILNKLKPDILVLKERIYNYQNLTVISTWYFSN